MVGALGRLGGIVCIAAGLGLALVLLVAPSPVYARSEGLPPDVPRPDFGHFLHSDYRATNLWWRSLSGGREPEAVITSVGPVNGDMQFRPVDIQVISWDPIARRWLLAFDAQKTLLPIGGDASSSVYGPMIDPTGNGQMGEVHFVHFGPASKPDLVFNASVNFGGSGSFGVIAVVRFDNGIANVISTWPGDGSETMVVRSGTEERLAVTAGYWSASDAHCCPVRTYRFVVGRHGAGVEVLSDDRPWLGIQAKPLQARTAGSGVRVVGVLPGSPAQGVLRAGDVIIGVEHPPRLAEDPVLGPRIYDQLALVHAGQTISLDVQRGRRRITVTVKLGSLLDTSAQFIPATKDYRVSTL